MSNEAKRYEDVYEILDLIQRLEMNHGHSGLDLLQSKAKFELLLGFPVEIVIVNANKKAELKTNFSEELTALIDKYIIENKMNYADAHAKAQEIVQAKEKEYWSKFDDDLASRSVFI